MVTAESKGTVGKFGRQLCNHLLAVDEQVAALAASLSLGPTKHAVKRLRHVAIGRHLLHDIAFSVHGLFCMEDKGLPSPGQTSSNRCRPTKLLCPTLDVSAFHLVEVLLLWLVSLGTASGTRPHRCTPIS